MCRVRGIGRGGESQHIHPGPHFLILSLWVDPEAVLFIDDQQP